MVVGGKGTSMKEPRLSSDIPKLSVENYAKGDAAAWGGDDYEYEYDPEHIEGWSDDPLDELVYHARRRGWIFGFEQGRFYGFDVCHEEIKAQEQQYYDEGFRDGQRSIREQWRQDVSDRHDKWLEEKDRLEDRIADQRAALDKLHIVLEAKNNMVAFLRTTLGMRPRKRLFRRRHGNQSKSTTE